MHACEVDHEQKDNCIGAMSLFVHCQRTLPDFFPLLARSAGQPLPWLLAGLAA